MFFPETVFFNPDGSVWFQTKLDADCCLQLESVKKSPNFYFEQLQRTVTERFKMEISEENEFSNQRILDERKLSRLKNEDSNNAQGRNQK